MRFQKGHLPIYATSGVDGVRPCHKEGPGEAIASGGYGNIVNGDIILGDKGDNRYSGAGCGEIRPEKAGTLSAAE